jgi:hypothetical protein
MDPRSRFLMVSICVAVVVYTVLFLIPGWPR